MNVVILGAGIGAIILSILWAVALLLCFISLRTKYNLGPFAISVTIVVTVLLLSVPRKSDFIHSLVPGEKVSKVIILKCEKHGYIEKKCYFHRFWTHYSFGEHLSSYS